MFSGRCDLLNGRAFEIFDGRIAHVDFHLYTAYKCTGGIAGDAWLENNAKDA
jgi:hypothetical protein